jgi:hypothetical protein
VELNKKAVFALIYFSEHKITNAKMAYVLRRSQRCDRIHAGDPEQLESKIPYVAARGLYWVSARCWNYKETLDRYCANIVPSYVAPIAEALYTELISRAGELKVDLLTLTPQQRRPYIDAQWPQDLNDQKRIVYNMYGSIVDFLDIEAIFDPPSVCTDEQVLDCHQIRYNLQTSFILAVDAYINIRLRYREGISVNNTYHLPGYPRVKSMDAAGRAFFDYWKRMPELDNFPRFPNLKFIPVAPVPGGRKRAKMDYEAPILPPVPAFLAAAAAAAPL